MIPMRPMRPMRPMIPMKLFMTTTSICASLSTYHQVYKIKKRKNAHHISLVNMSAVWINAGANLLYAISIKEPRLMMTFGNSFISLSTLICHTLYYRYTIEHDYPQQPEQQIYQNKNDKETQVETVDASQKES